MEDKYKQYKVQRFDSTTHRPASRILRVTSKSGVYQHATAGLCGWKFIEK